MLESTQRAIGSAARVRARSFQVVQPHPPPMQLAEFILHNITSILAHRNTLRENGWTARERSPWRLKDFAEEMLRAVAQELQPAGAGSGRSPTASSNDSHGSVDHQLLGLFQAHAMEWASLGAEPAEIVAEVRALRTAVTQLWRRGEPLPSAVHVAELTRFDELLDRYLTEAVRIHSEFSDHSRLMFLGILGHDLRGPLNAIALSAQALAELEPLPPEGDELAQQILTSANAMEQMMQDLLDFAQTRLGRALPINPAPFDLAVLVDEVLAEMRTRFPSHVFNLHREGDLNGTWDRTRLRQLVGNLLGNAVQHGDPHAPIEVTASCVDSHVLLSVRNQGAPIPAAALPRIFEPMFQPTHSARSQRWSGSMGLGLYIVKQVVQAHGGSVDVSSSNDTGTTFCARLPRCLPRGGQ